MASACSPGPHFAVGNCPDVVDLHAAAVGHGLHELAVHVIDQRLHVSLLGRSQVARRIARILEFAGLENTLFSFAHRIRSP